VGYRAERERKKSQEGGENDRGASLRKRVKKKGPPKQETSIHREEKKEGKSGWLKGGVRGGRRRP